MLAWDDIRIFLAIHRGGSLSAAARALKVNQTTVGRRLKALEDAADARLFDRTPDGFKPTAAGEALFAHGTRVEEEILTVERELSGHQEMRLEGMLRVTAPGTLGWMVVAPMMARFHERYPGILVELIAEDRVLNLSTREADVALRMPRPRQPNLVVRKMVDVGSGLFAAPAYLKKHPPLRAGLRGHEVIAPDDGFTVSYETRWLQKHAAEARVVLRTNSAHMTAEATAAGVGLGVIPCYIARRHPKLVRIYGPDVCGTQELWLAIHPDLRQSAKVHALSDFLAAEFARERDWLAAV